MMKSLPVLLIVALGAATALAGGLPADTHHNDHRTFAKIQFEPAWDSFQGGTPEGTARAYLENRAGRDGLPEDPSGFELVGSRESLLAHHVTFQQMLDGIPVQGGEIIVSIAKRDGRVLRTFNNRYPVGASAAFLPRSGMDREAAYDIAWQYLRAHGDLRSLPAAELVYTPEGPDFRLNWLVDLDLTGPDGAWRVRVDALSGQVVEVTDRRETRKRLETTVDERIGSHEGPLADRAAAFAQIREIEARRAAEAASPLTSRESGTGIVFDPDPRTTLRNASLQDNSPSGAFTDAYLTRNLQDIQFDGSVYRLNGPWVSIINWDPPNTPPSTTTDGNWTATRGNNAFNDALTYFQLDQNQRYMQSLGFTGAMGIQEGSIGVDTDGVGGADNSYYVAGSNRIAYGHGCVDDSEDADVILHEYGHAINHDINNSWFGGDTGAMGEGWGDYWAGSYSYSTPTGPEFYPNWVFSWDGHGVPVGCWPGRILNAFGAMYVHSVYYGAHQSIPGGYQSDELWSTPLFQSLLTLMEDFGETRESVDTILLESQFGLGSGLKMRDMANVIIATAQQLEPTGPHAEVFIEKFLAHNIILAPVPVVGVEAFEVVSEPSGNGAADPGETVEVRVTLNNSGLGPATAVSATLTTETAGVTIDQATADFPDLPIGGSGTSTVDYVVTVDGAVDCGTQMHFTLLVDYVALDQPTSVERNTQLFAGVPIGGYGAAAPYAPLPDNDGNEVVSTIAIDSGGALVSADLNLDVNITHDYIGDLIIRLVSPSGTQALLHAFGGGSADNIVGNYPNTLTPGQSLDRFIGEPLDGDWELHVRDGGNGGTGTFNTWALYDITDFDCDGGVVATPEAAPLRFALDQNAPNPFNPATEIRFTVPADAGVVTLEIFDLRGAKVRTLVRSPLEPGHHARMWDGRDDAGIRTSSGTYVYRLTGDGFVQTRKMVIVQ